MTTGILKRSTAARPGDCPPWCRDHSWDRDRDGLYATHRCDETYQTADGTASVMLFRMDWAGDTTADDVLMRVEFTPHGDPADSVVVSGSAAEPLAVFPQMAAALASVLRGGVPAQRGRTGSVRDFTAEPANQ